MLGLLAARRPIDGLSWPYGRRQNSASPAWRSHNEIIQWPKI